MVFWKKTISWALNFMDFKTGECKDMLGLMQVFSHSVPNKGKRTKISKITTTTTKVKLDNLPRDEQRYQKAFNYYTVTVCFRN